MEVKLEYQKISSFEFTQTMQKIANVATNNRAASHIRHVIKALDPARKEMGDAYIKEIMEVFGVKNEDGTLQRPEGEPQGFIPDETRTEEFLKAQEEFGKRIFIVKWRPLTPDTLVDIKLSAKELDVLGDLYSEENGPGLPYPITGPNPDNVTQLRQ